MIAAAGSVKFFSEFIFFSEGSIKLCLKQVIQRVGGSLFVPAVLLQQRGPIITGKLAGLHPTVQRYSLTCYQFLINDPILDDGNIDRARLAQLPAANQLAQVPPQ